MKFLIILISILAFSMNLLAKDKLQQEEPNEKRIGLEKKPSAISILTEAVGENLNSLEKVSGLKGRDENELFQSSKLKSRQKQGSGSSSSSEN